MVLEKIATHGLNLRVAKADSFLPGHVNDRRTFSFGKTLESTDFHWFGAVANWVAGADSVFGQQIKVGTAIHILFPVAAIIFQANEANFSSRRA